MREQKEDKAKKILAAALEILSKKGYENTTINDIADSAKLSRGLLHYYFKDKEDLVAQAMSFGFVMIALGMFMLAVAGIFGLFAVLWALSTAGTWVLAGGAILYDWEKRKT